MNSKDNFWAVALALIAVLIAIGAWVFPMATSTPSDGGEQGPTAGASTPGSRFPHGVTVGDQAYTPTNLALLKAGTCNAAMAASLAATSSGAATCTVTGALTGDIVNVQLPQAGAIASGYGGFIVSGTKATTDTITFNVFNQTGAATGSFPLATTSVQYQVWRTQ